jgi:hypothetical protein
LQPRLSPKIVFLASRRIRAEAPVVLLDPATARDQLAALVPVIERCWAPSTTQTVVEVASERNSTPVMPVPVELLRFFEKMTPAGPAAGLSPLLADFGDAEVVQAGAVSCPALSGLDEIMPLAGLRPRPGICLRGCRQVAVAGWVCLPTALRWRRAWA